MVLRCVARFAGIGARKSNIKEISMKKYRLIAWILVLAILSTTTMLILFCEKKKSLPAFAKAADSADGYAYVRIPEDRDLKILQITDIHLETWLVGDESFWNLLGIAGDNASTLVLIDKLIAAVDPDLVVITGDAVRSWTQDNLEMYAEIADIIEAREIPWMPMFGNHDSEYEFEQYQHTHAALAAALSAYPHCLMSDTSGAAVGEYFVNIKNKKDDIVYTLCAIGVYYDRSLITEDFASGWSFCRTDAQIDWYENTLKAVSALQNGEGGTLVPSMVFAHVPVPESLAAWEEAYNDGQPNDKYYYGTLFSGKSDCRKYLGEDLLFDKVVELGSTKAMFFGHYHNNDYSVDYRGVRLTAGQMTTNNMDYRIDVDTNAFYIPTEIDFSKLFHYGDDRGGTLITLSSGGNFTVSQALAREVIPDYYDGCVDYESLYAQLLEDGANVTR